MRVPAAAVHRTVRTPSRRAARAPVAGAVRRAVVGAPSILPALLLCTSPTFADTDLVALPEGYRSAFVRYASIDKPPGERAAKTRFFYVNPESLRAAEPGEPVPSGTVLIMEDRAVELDADGEPVLDANGRFVPTDEITNVFVQEKRDGWGTEYPAELRNGEWEYAWFDAHGERKADASFDGCFGCHKGAEEDDFNFTYSTFVRSIKP